MKSATTIRKCSEIMMIITIIASIVGGIALQLSSDSIIIMLLVWVVGIFAAIMQNALFQGIADIIDNTYATACKTYDMPVDTKRENVTGQITFQQTPPTDEKEKYANDLLSKGLISKEEYDEMSKKG